MSLPDLMTQGVAHEVLGACVLLNSTEKKPFYAPPETGEKSVSS